MKAKNLRLLKILTEVKDRSLQRKMLNDLARNRPSILYSLKRLCRDLLRGSSKLRAEEERLVLRHRKVIGYLANLNTKNTKELKQVGGFISYVLPLLLKIILDGALS